MFDRRLRILVFLFACGLLVVGVRLAQLQIVRADYYRASAARSLIQRPVFLPFVRGRILDRTGEVLARDEPCWDVTVDYDVLALDVDGDESRITRAARRWMRSEPDAGDADPDQRRQAFLQSVSRMWRDLALFTADAAPIGVPELRDRARRIVERVIRIRQAVARRRGFDAPVAEETTAHAILSGLDAERQVAAREWFSAYPWVQVTPSSRRRAADEARPFAHLLGRVGKVDAESIADDPSADDPFRRYQADDRIGVTGVEHVAEEALRGRRGQSVVTRDGQVVASESIPAVPGAAVSLTIHVGLQRRLFDVLRDVVEGIPQSSGGAVVVLDVPRREVLAMVSYPSYEPNEFDQSYARLRDDTERLPLRFRAVANLYPPGSVVKPLVCLAGFLSGQLELGVTEDCRGHLLADLPDRWRCWEVHGTDLRKAHGPVDVVAALTGSCNVFMYRIGERIGVDRLCSAFDMVGIGRGSGTGLLEEAVGVNPTPSWLAQVRNSPVYPAHARNFAIGQGELLMTPLQVANLMATYASGRFLPVSLIAGSDDTRPWRLPGMQEQWLAIRRGIYGVVNDPEGTAHKYAYFPHERYALCGKTGSATAQRRPTRYAIGYRDEAGMEQVAVIPAGAEHEAVARFRQKFPDAQPIPGSAKVISWWPREPPSDGDAYAHAWFGGYLQELDATGGPEWSREPRLAFAALVEYGGSGGRTSGPLARKVAQELLAVFGPDLNIDRGVFDKVQR